MKAPVRHWVPALLFLSPFLCLAEESAVSVVAPIDHLQQQLAVEIQKQQDLIHLQKKIETLETQQGAYGVGLAEALLEAAELQFELNMDEAAIDNIERGIHVVRTNAGPYALEQIPLIKRMVRHSFEQKNLSVFTQWLGSYMEIKNATLPRDDPEWVHIHLALEEVNFFNPTSLTAFLNLDDANQASDSALKQASLEQLLRIYELQKQQYFNASDSYGKSSVYDYTPTPSTSKEMMKFATGKPAWITSDSRRKTYKEGADYFSQVYGNLQAQLYIAPELIANTMLDEADWHLKFNEHSDAKAKYKECYAYLKQQGFEESRIDAIMNGDIPVAMSTLNYLEMTEDIEDQSYWQVDFAVSTSGKISGLKIEDFDDEGLKENTKRIKKILVNSRFRPRLKQGEPVKSGNYSYRIYADSYVYYKPIRLRL